MLDIWDKSTAWGRPRAFVSYTGIANRCKMSRRKVVYVVKSLVDAGVLDVVKTSKNNGYLINYEEVEAVPKLGTKGREVDEKKSAEVVHDVHSTSAPDAHKEQNNNLGPEKQSREPCRAHPRFTGAKALPDYIYRYTNKRVTGAQLERTWNAAWNNAPFSGYAGLRALSPKERGQLGRLKTYWQWDERELHFFIAWVVVDWRAIMRELSWIKSRPELPTTGFVLGFRDHLLNLWAEKARYDFTRDMSNDSLARLVAGGLSMHDALLAEERVSKRQAPKVHEETKRPAMAGAPKPWRRR